MNMRDYPILDLNTNYSKGTSCLLWFYIAQSQHKTKMSIKQLIACC